MDDLALDWMKIIFNWTNMDSKTEPLQVKGTHFSLLNLVHDYLELALLEEPLVEVVKHLEEEVHVLLGHVLVDHLLELLSETLKTQRSMSL